MSNITPEVTKTRDRAFWAQVIVLGLVVGLGLQFAQAWTAPTATAPGGNVSGPITTSSVAQTKEGGLTVGGTLLGEGTVSGLTLRARNGLVLEKESLLGCPALKTNALGTVVCDTNGGSENIAFSLYDRSRLYTCDRDANTSGGKDGTKVCEIPAGSPVNQLCVIERTFISDGSNDINGYGCWVRKQGSTWEIQATAIGVQRVMCNARCFY